MTAGVLVDSNVLLDILTEDTHWFSWSADRLAECADVSVGFARIEELEVALPHNAFTRRPLPWEAAFLAGKCFVRYRRAGGDRRSPLPDFFIGAHAAVEGLTLLTRDDSRPELFSPPGTHCSLKILKISTSNRTKRTPCSLLPINWYGVPHFPVGAPPCCCLGRKPDGLSYPHRARPIKTAGAVFCCAQRRRSPRRPH